MCVKQAKSPYSHGMMKLMLVGNARSKAMSREVKLMGRQIGELQQAAGANACLGGQLLASAQANLHVSSTVLTLAGRAAGAGLSSPGVQARLPAAGSTAGLLGPAPDRSKAAARRLRRSLLAWEPASADLSAMEAPLVGTHTDAEGADAGSDGPRADASGSGDAAQHASSVALPDGLEDASLQPDAAQVATTAAPAAALAADAEPADTSSHHAEAAHGTPVAHVIPGVSPEVEFVPGRSKDHPPWTQMAGCTPFSPRFATLSGEGRSASVSGRQMQMAAPGWWQALLWQLSASYATCELPIIAQHKYHAGFAAFYAATLTNTSHVVSADYGVHSGQQNGLHALYADCHEGFLLRNGSRTWSLMQLERAAKLPGKGKFQWRAQDQLKKHVQKLKDVYYEMWRQMAELGLAGADEASALQEVCLQQASSSSVQVMYSLSLGYLYCICSGFLMLLILLSALQTGKPKRQR